MYLMHGNAKLSNEERRAELFKINTHKNKEKIRCSSFRDEIENWGNVQ